MTGTDLAFLISTCIIATKGYPQGTQSYTFSFKLVMQLIRPVNPFWINTPALRPRL